ncbi:MAG: hypothetical protein HY821_22635 [Acidobacteria bacterium]|nr:hypothetical protein [Acidobacteriota bacterium]
MACYISSRNNRYYAAVEETYGTAAPVTAANRFNAVTLEAQLEYERPRRKDKTGTRTDLGFTGELKRKTRFSLQTYLYSRDSGEQAPRYSALVQSALGGAPRAIAGGKAVASANGLTLTFGAAHGLSLGDAISVGGDLRFVATVPALDSVTLSAPLRAGAGAGAVTGGAVAYSPATGLKGVTVYDYWDPETAVQRLLRGSAVNLMELKLNADFHELVFEGQAADLVDSKSFVAGSGGLGAFPAEPAQQVVNDWPVPGHLGQAWIGTGPEQLHTLVDARVRIKNNIDFRSKDFGALAPRCIVPGDREVTVDLEMYSQDRTVFDEIYQAARQQSPIGLTLQMGEAEGSMCGVYIPALIPAVPELLDDEERLRWRLRGCKAIGTGEDEVHVAFG